MRYQPNRYFHTFFTLCTFFLPKIVIVHYLNFSQEGETYMKKVRFSIIVTAYNIENYIQRALDSVLQQEFDDFQLIVVDDCSTDNTLRVISNYKDERIIVLCTQMNSGTAAKPRNIAMERAKGEYIIFLDGDDELYDSNVLRRIDSLIGTASPDIVFLGYQDAGNGNRYRLSNSDNSTKEARLCCDVSFSVSSKIWRRDFLEENNLRFIEKIYYEDQLFSMKGTVFSQNTIYGEFPVFRYYRNRPDSVMTTPSIKKCSDIYRVMAEITDLYRDTPDEYKKSLLSFIKNENDSIPLRIANNLMAMENGKTAAVMPKREYEYVDFFDN